MRRSAFFLLFAFSISGFAQDAAKPPQSDQQLDKAAQERIRTERAAGGMGKVTPEDKAGASAGEGPHKQFKPGGAARREAKEDSSEREAGRGATR